MKIKYLSDGRKVVVIGKLNNQESIVQEIFVSVNGNEIPSGENFTVKSLHDEPVLSYKEKQAQKVEEEINRLRNCKEKLCTDYKKSLEELKAITEILKSSRKLKMLLPESELEVFTLFITGAIEYLVVDDYYITPPVKLIDRVINWESERYGECRQFCNLKLISVLGKSNGELEYRIHEYSDHSGGSTLVHPFTSLEDALSYIKNRAEEQIEVDKLSINSYKNCIEMGIIFSDHHAKKYKDFSNRKIKKQIENEKENISKHQKRLDVLLELEVKNKSKSI